MPVAREKCSKNATTLRRWPSTSTCRWLHKCAAKMQQRCEDGHQPAHAGGCLKPLATGTCTPDPPKIRVSNVWSARCWQPCPPVVQKTGRHAKTNASAFRKSKNEATKMQSWVQPHWPQWELNPRLPHRKRTWYPLHHGGVG